MFIPVLFKSLKGLCGARAPHVYPLLLSSPWFTRDYLTLKCLNCLNMVGSGRLPQGFYCRLAQHFLFIYFFVPLIHFVANLEEYMAF